ncbi:hypothetical protein G3L11_001698 [Campylobacter jejuni]|uniref:Uncharacterized protein n=1 Tax=Campylobacter jejuni TaxID=197 RepID=A0AAN3U9K3_CAMJU|nr:MULTISPECIES: hypothetical protein [Campylobacter]EAI9739299.1 hypothetical protein [Campylobacter jejuni]EAK2198149.1 hypothetical protein [Campylobacter jejuni]EAK3496290.1 hypothetical protein [Campylobacter jejuni]EAL1140990.1 hypothetical protein [Campylobacter jejuni]ECL6143839.1 hypothetical protein [Campylobacter jejuni]
MNFQPRIIRDQNDEECYIMSLSDFCKKIGISNKTFRINKEKSYKNIDFYKEKGEKKTLVKIKVKDLIIKNVYVGG